MHSINNGVVNFSLDNNFPFVCHDACAIVVAMERDSITESRGCTCTVELRGMMTRGQMKSRKPEAKDTIKAKIEIVTKFDMKRFYRMLDDATT